MERRSECEAKATEHMEFERRAKTFINKLAPKNATRAALDFASSDIWGDGEKRCWRQNAFVALLLRSFSKIAGYRPAQGRVSSDLSILSNQVIAVCKLLECTPELRGTLDRWMLTLLGCQSFWSQQRLAVCLAWYQLSSSDADLCNIGALPMHTVRKILDMICPEALPPQAEVVNTLSPRTSPINMAIVLGHLVWSCSTELWKVWCPLAFTAMEALMETSSELQSPGPTERLHQVAMILYSVCQRLVREPLGGAVRKAVSLGRSLVASTHHLLPSEAPGFVKHRIEEAILAAETLENGGPGIADLRATLALDPDAVWLRKLHVEITRIQAHWRGRLARHHHHRPSTSATSVAA